ncbi:MAG: archaemetzincin family Zn-dependent metalloprotease [Acidobacteriia bacterium]|nr:archaemetzincin family Zn-dependent metalloprotease [Terriglobia bacterium]
MASLCLVPIYFSDRHAMIELLAERISRTFSLDVHVRPPWFDPELPFDPARGQYNSTLFLGQLLRGLDETASRVLGITSVDLYVPVLTFVFGEAQLAGKAAVVSTHRLRNEAYGLPADDGFLMDRLGKEAVHEIGHTYGLVHCVSPTCVMRSSTYVEEIDLKSPEFCPACREEIPRGA